MDELKIYDWAINGKIDEIPNFSSINQLVNESKIDSELLDKEKNSELKNLIQKIVIDCFDNIANKFKTNKISVELHKNIYDINPENNIFFWESKSGEVFYQRPALVISTLELALIFVQNKLFENSFFDDLSTTSNDWTLCLANQEILKAVKNAFDMKISKVNFNGNSEFKNEIVEYIENDANLTTIMKLKR